jgi:arabinogalactan oligomer/maltooligosaccharide transport system substrate-binding protein
MKKKVLAMALATTMVATSFAGCGASGSNSGSNGDSKDITLTVWSPAEDQSKDEGNWLKKECEAFNKEHPEWNIKFKYGVCPEGEAKDKVTTDVDAAADVYMFANDNLSALVKANAIAKLGGKTLEQIKDQNDELMLNTVTYKDSVYGVPFTANTWFMYYDKSVFSEDEAKSLDTMLAKDKVSFPLSNSWYIASAYVANGCTLFGDEQTDEKAGINFGGDNATAVTNYLIDLSKNPNFQDDKDNSGQSAFCDGSVKAFFSGTWAYSDAKKALGDNLGIATPPTIKINGEDKQLKSFAGSKAIGVNPNSKHQEVAVALAAYLGSEKAQKDHFELRNIVPSDKNIDVSSDVLSKAQSDTIAKASIMQPMVDKMGNYWGPAQSMGEEILAGTVTKDNAADKTAKMNEAMNTDAVK